MVKGPKGQPDRTWKEARGRAGEDAGILASSKMNEGSHLASIFGRETARHDAVNCVGPHLATKSVRRMAWRSGSGGTARRWVYRPEKAPSVRQNSAPWQGGRRKRSG